MDDEFSLNPVHRFLTLLSTISTYCASQSRLKSGNRFVKSECIVGHFTKYLGNQTTWKFRISRTHHIRILYSNAIISHAKRAHKFTRKRFQEVSQLGFQGKSEMHLCLLRLLLQHLVTHGTTYLFNISPPISHARFSAGDFCPFVRM